MTRPRGAIKRLAFAIVLIALGIAATALLPHSSKDLISFHFDRTVIGIERAQRSAYAALGWTFPGTPDRATFQARLEAKGAKLGDPIFMRIFKREFQLELWTKRNGRFHLFATYPICRWSGRLGPKIRQGDLQAPEGFYTVASAQLNPNSRWHRSFNLGFPNAFDRSHGRSGSFLMVHGGCSSIGCYAMTNDVIDELWQFITSAFSSGQKRFQVQVFPFRMTEWNLKHRAGHPSAAFWQDLKPGFDLFEQRAIPPRVGVCNGRYQLRDPLPGSDGSSIIAQGCRDATISEGPG